MNRIATLLVLLLAPSAARADVAPRLWSQVLPTEYTFELDREYPGVEFFLCSGDKKERLALALDRPVTVDSVSRLGIHRIADLVAVFGEGQAITLTARPAIDFRADVPVHDTRDRVSRTYRVSIRANELHLTLVRENRESTGTQLAKVVAAVFLTAAAILCVRRFRRRRSVAPAARPA